MKVLKFLGIAIMTTIISISFIACSDDEDKQSNPVIGTWEITGGSDMTLEIYIHFIQMEQFPLTLREKPMSIIIILILIIPFWLLTMKMVMAMKKCI